MLTKKDRQSLNQDMKHVFATKDDLKNLPKNPEFQQSLNTSIRVELHAVKDDWIRKITDEVTRSLGTKIDKMYVKLDSFIGEISARRTEQELHSGQHKKLNDRLGEIEKNLAIPSQF